MTDTTVKEAGGFLAAKQGGDGAYTAAKEAAAYSELASEAARCATGGRTRIDTTIKPTVGDGGETTMIPGRVYAAYEDFICEHLRRTSKLVFFPLVKTR
jgi:hypothetical protein